MIAEELGNKYDTLRKAINQGRLRQPALPAADEIFQKPAASDPSLTLPDKSSRSDSDAAAGQEMGIACTRPTERVLAAVGLLPDVAPT